MQMTTEFLARKVRMEHIDLLHSFLAETDEEFVAVALLALRGREAWCAGLGIAPNFRGRGFGQQVMSEFISRAKGCGVTKIRLEVLTNNAPAIRLYERCGMRITRDLLILERAGDVSNKLVCPRELQQAEPVEMLRHFERLHAWQPAWQRSYESLLSADGIYAVYLGDKDKPDAYALMVKRPDGVTQVLDLATSDAEAADELAAAITNRHDAMRMVNEPEESTFVAPLLAHGFTEVGRQYEMSSEVHS